jgi:fatty acyl-CoA reductase
LYYISTNDCINVADNILKLIHSLDEEKLEAITPTIIGKFPNTYTYTKCISEQAVQQYGKDLPIGIFRPAISKSTFFFSFEKLSK